MPPRKKAISLEEKRRRKKEAEKRRRDRIKADPEKYEAAIMKEKQRREKRKAEKKIKKICDLTPRQQRGQRKAWQERTRKCRRLKKERQLQLEHMLRENTPASTDDEIGNIMEENQNENINQNEPPISSPSILIEHCNDSMNRNDSSHWTPSTSVDYRQNNMNQNESRLSTPSTSLSTSSLASMVSEQSRQKLQGALRIRKNRTIKMRIIERQKEVIDEMKKKIHALQVKYNRLVRKIPLAMKRNKSLQYKTPIHRLRKTAIKNFLEEDENTKMCPGKRDTVTKNKAQKQKRYLCDSLENLHKKYNAQVIRPSLKVSYASFCRLKPFWIMQQKVSERDTCLCVSHENFTMMLEKLNRLNIIKLKNVDDLCDSLVCDKNSRKCMYGHCDFCKNKVPEFLEFEDSDSISYKQWFTKTETRIIKNKERNIKRTVKEEIICKKKELIDKFLQQIPEFLKHIYNIYHQYKSIKLMKENLSEDEVLCHVDFSENYQCKYATEAQSVHFGASRQQISLHTGVFYYKNNSTGLLDVQSFCTASDCLRHDAAAIYAHLKIAVNNLLKDKTLKSFHVLSDGPSSQYKNKSNFFLFTQHLLPSYGIKQGSWNFSEKSHGKGAPDGIGGVIKRTADKHIAHGQDIPDFKTFINKIQELCSIPVYQVTQSEIEIADDLLKTILKPIPGTSCAHQVTWTNSNPSQIFLRDLTCLECPLDTICEHGSITSHMFADIVVNAAMNSNDQRLENDPNLAKRKIKTVPSSTKLKSNIKRKRTESAITEEKKYFCTVCQELYKEPIVEDWIQCSQCKEWTHEACSTYSGAGEYVCNTCED